MAASSCGHNRVDPSISVNRNVTMPDEPAVTPQHPTSALVRMFPDVRFHTPYPIRFGGDDWITVVTNATGTFTGEMTLPDGNVIPPTGKAFDLEFAQTSKWAGDQLIVISAFWDTVVQRRQIGLA